MGRHLKYTTCSDTWRKLCLQCCSKLFISKCWVAEIVRQRVPGHRANNRECPMTKLAVTMLRNGELVEQSMPLMRYMFCYLEKKCVFSAAVNFSSLSVGSQRLSGREFQVIGPTTDKGHAPHAPCLLFM